MILLDNKHVLKGRTSQMRNNRAYKLSYTNLKTEIIDNSKHIFFSDCAKTDKYAYASIIT